MKNIMQKKLNGISVDHIVDILNVTAELADKHRDAVESDRQRNNTPGPPVISAVDIARALLVGREEYSALCWHLGSLNDDELRVVTYAMIEGRDCLSYAKSGHLGELDICPLRLLEKRSWDEVPMGNRDEDISYVAGKTPLGDYLRAYLQYAER